MGDRENRILGLAFAAMFSVSYAGLYPMLTGNFVIYWYPYWPAPAALLYVLGGILLQAWFCLSAPDRRIGPGLGHAVPHRNRLFPSDARIQRSLHELTTGEPLDVQHRGL